MTTTTGSTGPPDPAVSVTTPDVAVGRRSPGALANDLVRRVYAALQQEARLGGVLVGSYIARWLVADRNSYWLDELYSVAVYGIWNNSAASALRRLAESSAHPPLYQAILYYWMELFGDGERATRSLSNLYITLATLFLYLLIRDALSRRVALWSAVTFALMYTPMYFGQETRSYAQTMFLTTLSSYAVFRLIRIAAARGWRSALFSPAAALFTGANVALLLTHYFNMSFYFAQGAMAGIFVLCTFPPRRYLAGLGTVAAMYAVQGTTFTLIWGDVLLDTYRHRGGAFPVHDGGLRSPLALLSSVVTPNLDAPQPVWWIGVLILGVVVVRAVKALLGGRALTEDRQHSWTILYLVGWFALPALVLLLGFLVTGRARYSTRYLLYAMPALAPLVVLTIGEAARLVGMAWRRVRGVGLDARVLTDVGMAVVILTLVLPGTFRALGPMAARDWASIARTIATIVDSDPDSRYVVFDTAFRSTSVLDYYLARFSDDVRVTGVIRVNHELLDKGFSFESLETEIQRYDFLVVAFVHHKINDFPNAMKRLSEMYRIYLRQIDESGKGLVIFSVHPRDGATPRPAATGPN